ncbi:UDP-N-acetylmuramoyl-tripeptide--D-alanyl-D-alanine ligase [Litorimonas sp.]|uniref:UDP-N-acetylmuramoyl-tripeptide--D-alanyl-D- alanine ligase n=1 Tax=Litorimonas sp. TaxID=1892381 RepID=UPI003A8AC9CE
MSLWTSKDIALATGGTATKDFSAEGLSIDTRTLKRGDLFVALKSERDGHDFIAKAMEAGAVGALAEKQVGDANTVIVADTQKALEALGAAGRDRSNALRIAVTGSVGKTSIKEALATIFSQFGETHKSQKSFNNHLGAPITLATLPADAKFGIFELGMNHAGEISALSKQVKPDIALISNVVSVHLAHFDSEKDIARAKAEIIDGLSPDGTLILNGDNPHTDFIKSLAGERSVLTFGKATGCDVQIIKTETHAAGGTVTLKVAGEEIEVILSVPGEHWFNNAAACLAVAKVAGLDLTKAAKAMAEVGPAQGRGDSHALTFSGKSFTLIDESYNANPTSMRAAFAAASLRPGRKIAVLGDMGELGPKELEFHAELAEPLEKAGFERVILKGECMRVLRGAIPRVMRGAWADSAEGVFSALEDEIKDGDVVLVKGSNAAGLGALVKKLKEGAH